MTNTNVVAALRGSLRLTNHDAAGSSPNARKNATPISSKIEETDSSTRTAP